MPASPTAATHETIGLDLLERESQRGVLAVDGTVAERRIAVARERFTAVLGGARRRAC